MAGQPLSPATDRRHGGPLPHHLANQTRGHLPAIKSLTCPGCPGHASCGISSRFQLLSPTLGQVPHALLTRSPLSYKFVIPKESDQATPFDLHVLGAPPAFVLSQDQTLYKIISKRSRRSNRFTRFSILLRSDTIACVRYELLFRNF